MKVHPRVAGLALKPAIPFCATLDIDHIERPEHKKYPVATVT